MKIPASIGAFRMTHIVMNKDRDIVGDIVPRISCKNQFGDELIDKTSVRQ